ncbi:alpha/beta hydrolase [Pannonibacter tanglangensis]|uniref:Alpha/beta fold hydrolase n=1 Tax=Pannonibacter tanglangensis TaxID=2750084 RepID=A0ABW9ZK65_9HYPH|nr:alpha/beta hydrolase [Pannonibacter sp. XCT-34]NBN65303.1 alpha/beta fold hydrolase [Pannonibacter sp. XCT-34]
MLLTEVPGNPVPDGALAGFLDTSDGARLRYARFPATGSPLKGTVTVLQGRAEFIEKYFEVIRELQQRGFHVVAFDWRGQGGSSRHAGDPLRGHVRDFAEYRRDLDAILSEIVLAQCPGPHFALAHSTGGAILLSHTERLRTRFARAVLTAPLVGLLDAGWREGLAYSAARWLCRLGLGRLFIPGGTGLLTSDYADNRQTSDAARFERMNAVVRARPDLGVGSPTNAWLAATGRTLLSFRSIDFGPSVHLPLLILAAGADRIVSTPATEELATRMKAAAFLAVPGARHEILMEADVYRDQFWAAFDAFVPGSD